MSIDTLETTAANGNQPTISDFKLASPLNFSHRIQDLGLVLIVGLSMPILGVIYSLLGGTHSAEPFQQRFRLVTGLVFEAIALLMLAYVLSRQGRIWKDIGLAFRWRDPLVGIGLIISCSVIVVVIYYPFQLLYRQLTGHFLIPEHIHFGFGISVVSVAFACLNPFFEELIVRAYVMSEVTNLGGARWLAVVISVALQISYHLYQGVANVITLTIIFIVFSIYYAYTRRIMPVILAHFAYDLFALVKGAS